MSIKSIKNAEQVQGTITSDIQIKQKEKCHSFVVKKNLVSNGYSVTFDMQISIYLNIYPYYKNHPVIPPSHPGVTREILLYEGRKKKNKQNIKNKNQT